MHMTITITDTIDDLDWVVLNDLLTRGFGYARSQEVVKQTFTGSYACCFAWQDGTLVGAARAISDGVACSAIYDVAVDPALQGQGVGRALMRALLARLPKRSVMLVSTMGNEDFYRKLGFRKMRTAYILMEDFRGWEAGGYLET